MMDKINDQLMGHYIRIKLIRLVYKLFYPLSKSNVIEKQILREMLNFSKKYILLGCTKIEYDENIIP